jgi:hypothetical protein
MPMMRLKIGLKLMRLFSWLKILVINVKKRGLVTLYDRLAG